MPDYIATKQELTSIADAIRAKGGTEAPLAFPAEFIAAIEAIKAGGGMQFVSSAKGKTSPKGKANSVFTLLGTFTGTAIGKRGHKAYATGYVDYEKLKFISEAKEYGT